MNVMDACTFTDNSSEINAPPGTSCTLGDRTILEPHVRELDVEAIRRVLAGPEMKQLFEVLYLDVTLRDRPENPLKNLIEDKSPWIGIGYAHVSNEVREKWIESMEGRTVHSQTDMKLCIETQAGLPDLECRCYESESKYTSLNKT